MQYVKTCRQCGHKNKESASLCTECHTPLIAVPALPDDTPPHADKPAAAPPAPEPPAKAPSGEAPPVEVTQRHPGAPPVVYLEVAANGQCFQAQSGWVLGQAHPTSDAQIQLAELPGVEFVHRRHCAMEFDGGQWYVRAIEQTGRPGVFTNPTLVNHETVPPGERHALRDGDRLMLSDVVVHVRVIGT